MVEFALVLDESHVLKAVAARKPTNTDMKVVFLIRPPFVSASPADCRQYHDQTSRRGLSRRS